MAKSNATVAAIVGKSSAFMTTFLPSFVTASTSGSTSGKRDQLVPFPQDTLVDTWAAVQVAEAVNCYILPGTHTIIAMYIPIFNLSFNFHHIIHHHHHHYRNHSVHQPCHSNVTAN